MSRFRNFYKFLQLSLILGMIIPLFSSCFTVAEQYTVCPKNSVLVASDSKDVQICVDRFESTLAKSKLGEAFPIASMNYYECSFHCGKQNKRLLTHNEWLVACEGTKAQHCNRDQPHPVLKMLKSEEDWFYNGLDCKDPKNTWRECMQDPRLNLQEQSLSRNNDFDKCISDHGVQNMVGNLGEWVKDFREEKGQVYGRFNGGLYPKSNSSCSYTTVAHTLDYKDYSIGCRCAIDL